MAGVASQMGRLRSSGRRGSGLLVDDHEDGLVRGAEHRVDERQGGGAW